MTTRRARTPSPPTFGREYLVLCAFLAVLTIAGGGSRADITGQVIVRLATVAVLIFAVLTYRPQPLGAQRSVLLLLVLAIALPLMQLIPIPPGLWQSLPNRGPVLVDPAIWRPISISPGATINALLALTVPLATFLLLPGANDQDRMPGYLLVLVLMSALLGALQFVGAGPYNLLVNTTPGSVVGFFANRNHFALFLAIGCLIAPVWGFAIQRSRPWRVYTAPPLCGLLLLLILASGSRAGIVMGMAGLILGGLIARAGIQKRLRTLPPRRRLIVIVAAIGITGAFVLSAIVFGRAESINRAMAMDVTGDQRVAALPVVLSMVKSALPLGNGFGSFDPAFRTAEVTALLKRTYFNHAHNDFLEIVIDGGLPALALLFLAVGWWIAATVRVWRRPSSQATLLGRVGSGVILITAAASVVDYPARTPLILAIITIAAVWLAHGTSDASMAAKNTATR